VISERMGRLLSAAGGILLITGLFLTWYHIERPTGLTDSTTGWETFTRLRVVIVGGAAVLLMSAILSQSRALLITRTLLGVALGVLTLRRIVFPPDLGDPISSQFGVFVGLAGALCAVLGGLVDTGRDVVERYAAMAFWRPPAGELGPGSQPTPSPRARRPYEPSGGAVIDSTAEDV
jgi:hypothetical protein